MAERTHPEKEEKVIPNTKQGSLVITKATTGGDATSSFAVTGPNAYSSTKSITTMNGTGSVTISNLAPGTYTIVETPPAGGASNDASLTKTGVVTAGGSVTVAYSSEKGNVVTPKSR